MKELSKNFFTTVSESKDHNKFIEISWFCTTDVTKPFYGPFYKMQTSCLNRKFVLVKQKIKGILFVWAGPETKKQTN